MTPEDNKFISELLKEKNELAPDELKENSAMLAGHIKNVLLHIQKSPESKEFVLASIVAHVLMHTTTTNDQALRQLNSVVLKTREYIISIDNLLIKGE